MANKDQEFLDEIMGFDPSNLTAFQEPTDSANEDPQIYNTNPVKFSKTEDGHYHASVRVLYNPFNIKESVIKQVVYRMQDEAGFFSANSSLSVGDKNCPLFKAWKKLHFAKKQDGSEDTIRKAWGDDKYEKRESRWVLVQIIEDENQPELVGQIKAWKLPKAVWTKMDAKMNPSPDSKKTPVALMDYLLGPVLTLDVAPGPDDKDHPERKQREISYDLCEFETDPTPIVMATEDGSEALFTDDELEQIEAYFNAKGTIAKESAKPKTKTTEKKISEAEAEIKTLTPEIKKMYLKAIAYMKQHSFDIAEKFGYKPWDAELTARVQNWIDRVANMEDPASPSYGAPAPVAAVPSETTSPSEDDVFADAMDESDADDMPF
jgi:hypothetical protein